VCGVHLSAALCSSERTRRVCVHPERQRWECRWLPRILPYYINELNAERQKIFRSPLAGKAASWPNKEQKRKESHRAGTCDLSPADRAHWAHLLSRVLQVAARESICAVFILMHWSKGNSLKISTCRWRCLISLCFRHFSAFCFAPGANGFRFTR